VGPVSAGETVKLKCNLHGASSGTYEINWVRQTPGKTPQGVLVHATDRKIYRAPGITDRFTPTAHDSSFTYYLTVGNVETSDGAVYYCMVWVSGYGYTVIHGLTKTSPPQTTGPSGTLHPLPPSGPHPPGHSENHLDPQEGRTPTAGNHGQLTFDPTAPTPPPTRA